MRRYWVETEDIKSSEVTFRDETFHHIFSVCRQELDSEFEVLTKESKAYLVKVAQVGKREARAQILSSRDLPALPRPHIHLVLSVPKFPVLDAVIEKSVEIGVKSIHLIYSDHSFVRKSDSISPSKIERWEKIVRSATQQSGRGDLMELHAPVPLDSFLSKINQNESWMGLFAYEGKSHLDIRKYLEGQRDHSQSKNHHQIQDQQLGRGGDHEQGRVQGGGNDLQDVWVFVGSEGGFSLREVELMEASGLKPVTLGSQVLRVETACVTLVSVIKYDFNQWK